MSAPSRNLGTAPPAFFFTLAVNVACVFCKKKRDQNRPNRTVAAAQRKHCHPVPSLSIIPKERWVKQITWWHWYLRWLNIGVIFISRWSCCNRGVTRCYRINVLWSPLCKSTLNDCHISFSAVRLGRSEMYVDRAQNNSEQHFIETSLIWLWLLKMPKTKLTDVEKSVDFKLVTTNSLILILILLRFSCLALAVFETMFLIHPLKRSKNSLIVLLT